MVSLATPRSSVVLAIVAAFVVLFAGTCGPARAEEAVILDNGAVLRGSVLREDAKEVVFKLDGIGRESRVTIEKSRIAHRFVTKDPRALDVDAAPAGDRTPALAASDAPILASFPSRGTHASTSLASLVTAAPTLPDEEPTATDEDFFRRSARRAILAFPTSPGMRGALVALAIALLLALIEIGGRMIDVDGLTLGKSTTLALLLALLVSIDALAADTLLRADRAPMLIIAELLAWVGCTAGVLRCGIASAFQLLAFVLFSGLLVALVTGALLVTI